MKKYLPEKLPYDIFDFKYDASEYTVINGKKFQVILIKDKPSNIPFLSISAGNGIEKNPIYYRGNTNTDEATYDQIQEILARRTNAIAAITSEKIFNNDLFQLKQLYNQISTHHNNFKYTFDVTIQAINS